ncbi:hypothetical protein DN051_31520 [Streptomyces cadmiisoli]|uniref:Uncharacterized protein n=1 Tax=Streptomyces cadmiisoli TaxID=2184053 RepID=A0A2Z4J6P8_9ACTN|nr:hypothetical protein DN051_31520 [Streptomyces cadmiisoli]
MTPTYTATGRQLPAFVPVPAESLPRLPGPPAPQVPDPPIYRDLMHAWSTRGRTVPGRHDPEWIRLAAPLVRPGQFSASPDPRDDVR